MFYIGDREGRGGVFRRLCVVMILGWDFYWFGVRRGCDVFLWGLPYKSSVISPSVVPMMYLPRPRG